MEKENSPKRRSFRLLRKPPKTGLTQPLKNMEYIEHPTTHGRRNLKRWEKKVFNME
jgi:hypothetical protein